MLQIVGVFENSTNAEGLFPSSDSGSGKCGFLVLFCVFVVGFGQLFTLGGNWPGWFLILVGFDQHFSPLEAIGRGGFSYFRWLRSAFLPLVALGRGCFSRVGHQNGCCCCCVVSCEAPQFRIYRTRR